MQTYDLAELFNSATEAELPRIVERLSTERKYRKAMRKILREVGSEINKAVLVAYAEQLENEDLTTEALLLALFWLLNKETEKAIVTVSALIRGEVRYIDGKFIQAVKTATKVDVSALARPNQLDDVIDALVKRNVSLITDVSEQTRNKIERAVIDAQLKKTPVNNLKKELRKILKTQANRADLIATDQLEKLSTQIVAKRAQQAGLYLYRWNNQGDGRVRHKHSSQVLGGTIQDSRKPDHGDDGQFPREPIRCRCWATWIVGSNR